MHAQAQQEQLERSLSLSLSLSLLLHAAVLLHKMECRPLHGILKFSGGIYKSGRASIKVTAQQIEFGAPSVGN